MKNLLKALAKVLLAVGLSALAYKGGQKLCWDNKASFVEPASLDSWDPTERFEAARQSYKKYGGKE